MSFSKHKYNPSYELPEELLSEMFKRLPVKHVLRCGAVQKSWYSLIRTPMFISLHSNHQKMTADDNPKYLLFDDTSAHELTVRSDDEQCRKYCTFSYPLDLPTCSWYTQLNGLVCVSKMFGRYLDYNPAIYIWNPLVNKFKTVPDWGGSALMLKEINWNALAFGFLPEVNDYVVVHVVKPRATSEPELGGLGSHLEYKKYPHSVMIGVYSLNTNTWREMVQEKVFVDYICTNSSVFVNGTAYWVGYDWVFHLVMCFDTKTNVLQTIRVAVCMAPWDRHHGNPQILPFGQSIGYFVEIDKFNRVEDDDYDYGYPHLDIWALNDDMVGVFDELGTLSWDKKMSVGLSKYVLPDVLGIRNNGEPIQATLLNKLISYDLDIQEGYDFVDSCDRLTSSSYYEKGYKSPFVIRPFVETLLFLDMD